MKIQFLNGGLANQAFQYIFAKYYELSHPGQVMYLDDSYFALNTVHNGYELEKVFGIKAPMLSDVFDEEVWNFILEQKKQGKSVPQILCENDIPIYMLAETENYKTFNPFDGQVFNTPVNEYNPEILNYKEDIYYHGYWINKNWFDTYKEEFLKIFTFPDITDEKNKKYMDAILNSDSCSIHIRRGDYVTLGCAVEVGVYRELIEMFLEQCEGKWEVFVFSDDIEWCKEHGEELGLSLFSKVHFIEGNISGKNYIDLQLMSNCKAMIMSNSAFCYLAALLNTKMQFVLNSTEREV